MELTSKLMVKDKEIDIKDAAWNNEYASLVVAIDDLKAKALKRYEECLGNRVSQFLAYRFNPHGNRIS